MIHYALRCGGGHEFDGWFASSAAFDGQAAGGLLECPVCADTQVARALMAPRLGRDARPPAEPRQAAVEPASPETASPKPALPSGPPPRLPDGVRAVLARMRAEVERNCDYVGPGFAAEARAIHAGTAPHRGIYGEASREQVEALAEEGIDVSSLPWVPRADA